MGNQVQVLKASSVEGIGNDSSAAVKSQNYGKSALQVLITAIDAGTILSVFLGQAEKDGDRGDTARILSINAADVAKRDSFLAPVNVSLLEDIDVRWEVLGGNVTFSANQIYYDSLA